MKKETFVIPLPALEIIDEYLKLHLGGKEVQCPYYMNTVKERAGLRALIGKGEPTEIEKEVMVWAKLKDFDLYKSSPMQIREFMIKHNIGIDCSGFIVHVLNFWLKTEGKYALDRYLIYKKNGIIDRIRRMIRPVENISANTLTNIDNCQNIDDLNQIQPGDLIRSKGKQKNSHHVMLITKVVKQEGQVIEFEFAHSSKTMDSTNGVKLEKIKILNINKSLSQQAWPKAKNGKSSLLESYKNNEEDNGIRRLIKVPLKLQ